MMKPRIAHNELRKLAVLLLVLCLAAPGWTQEVSPMLLRAAREAYQQEQQKDPQILLTAQVDPKLVGKKVMVRYHDGRVVKGKLLEATSQIIRLKTQTGIEEIPLAQVRAVEKRPSKVGRNAMIVTFVGLGVFLVFINLIFLTET